MCPTLIQLIERPACKVVVDLIREMKQLGHPSYTKADMQKVEEKAAELPKDGVPPEVLRIIQEELGNDGEPMDSKLQPQKAATPCEAPQLDPAAAGRAFAAERPRSVVAEGREQREAHEAEKQALENMVAELGSDGIRTGLETYEVRAGNQLVDMFRPVYWAMVFGFLFKHATAEPDVVNTIKTQEEGMEPSRRKKGNPKAPEVGIQAWAGAMQRQVASQFRRDWNFSPTLWNYLFRTRVNLQPNAYMFRTQDADGTNRRHMTTKEIETAVQGVYRKLHHGTYVDINNENKAVNGDLAKLRYVRSLTPGEHQVLNNLEARTRKVPGTQAVRTSMRQQTHAYRANYGLSAFITFSPSEKDSALMVRMARVRQSDPAIAGDSNKAFYTREKPELDVEFCRLSVEQLAEARGCKECRLASFLDRRKVFLDESGVYTTFIINMTGRFLSTRPCEELPGYEARRELLARDPLACLYGFQVLVGLALRHIFGLRFCPKCPDCACSSGPCTDVFGNNAKASGGVFGRIDAVYGSLECQKCGAYHIHLQIFLECLHQFTPLSSLVKLGREPLLELLRKYSDYSAHVRRMVYRDPEEWHEEQHEIEDQWPEYKQATLMQSRPGYQTDHGRAAADWRMAYLCEDVDALQKHKQHHVHILDRHGVRQPLNHCRDRRDPTKCKAHFPREKWLTENPFLVCPNLAKQKDMPHKGKRSMVGMPWGPCNDANVNGNHPALLAAARCNGDVQLPYRFPITIDTHNHEMCHEQCHEEMSLEQLVREAQINQAAQAGYACDYQNKRAQIANHETKEMMKGQQHMYEELKDNKPGYYGARTVKRLMTDLYGRGIVRGAVETTNLNTMAEHPDPTRAESVKTAQVTDISLQYPLQLLQHIAAGKPWPKEQCKPIVDHRNRKDRKLIECPPWTTYGGRGQRPEVHMLSAYEFGRHFHLKQAKHNYSVKKQQHECPEKYEAELTEEGLLQVSNKINKLRPGKDYIIREAGGDDWWPLGGGQQVQAYRHDWIIKLRPRPHVPVILGAQGSRTTEEQAMRILVLYFPWVNDAADASPQVPFINGFWQSDMQDWTEALMSHACRVGFPTEEVKRLVMNFVFTYCLPRQMRLVDGLAENSDNEDIEDELVDFHLDGDDLLAATRTHVRGSGLKAVEEENVAESQEEAGSQAEQAQEPAAPTLLYDMTMHMFELSNAIWREDDRGDNLAAQQRHEEMLRSAAASDINRDAALRAAKKSSDSKKKALKGTGLIGALDPELEAGTCAYRFARLSS